MDRGGPDKWQRGSHPLHHVGYYDSQKRPSSLSVDIKKRSLLPDSCLSAACGPRRSKNSRFSSCQTMNASYKFSNHQCSSEERRMRRDSNRLRIRPLKNIEMPIRWITKSSQFRISIHVRRMKTHFQVRTITVLDFIIQIARCYLLSDILSSNLYLHRSKL